MYLDQQKHHLLHLGLRPEAFEQLRKYIELLWQENKTLNLFSRQMTIEELVDNHVIDCLLPLKFFPRNLKKVADFGSGGGLPAVIYALQFPQIEFHLYEKSILKQNFLKKCARIFPNVHVHGDIPQKLDGIQMVIARAFKPLDLILQMSRDYYDNNGTYFLLKARKEKIDEELFETRKKFKDVRVQIESLISPVLENERHLVLVSKMPKARE